MAHKFCQSCSKQVISTMRVCPSCGSKEFLNEKIDQQTTVTPVNEVSNTTASKKISIAKNETRPWVRYWAKYLDLTLFGMISGGILGLLFPDYILGVNQYALGIEIAFLYIFVEPILLSEFGTTFGKWLLKIKLSLNSGEKITYSKAFKRSFKVWWRGLALNVPLISLVTHFIAYDKLVRNGATSWDLDEGFEVTHEKIGWLRISTVVILFVLLTLLIVSTTILKNDTKNQISKTNTNQITDTRSYY